MHNWGEFGYGKWLGMQGVFSGCCTLGDMFCSGVLTIAGSLWRTSAYVAGCCCGGDQITPGKSLVAAYSNGSLVAFSQPSIQRCCWSMHRLSKLEWKAGPGSLSGVQVGDPACHLTLKALNVHFRETVLKTRARLRDLDIWGGTSTWPCHFPWL